LNIHHVRDLEIPLPPLAEQRRIAEVLDRAEALRAKRRAALAQLDSLTQSIFFDLFGDPSINPKRWPMLRLVETLTIPLRNGLSPSHTGKISAKVLTLSAITGNNFDETALKVATFRVTPPVNQTVDEDDFLICRGNGNIRLVGKGYFPSRQMSDVTFPDTMIAARVSPSKIDRAFLQQVWNSPIIRKQVESLARTTNGTFKVNQTMLEEIRFVAPPIALQREFARRVAAVEKLKSAQRASLAELDALFASLQHRAFRGEL
jgi:type I restriction enzyme S subunit